jgi:cell wall-associated NlpC family hydrolase
MRTRRSSPTLVTAILAAVLAALPWTTTSAVAAGPSAAAGRLTPVTKITPVTGCHDLTRGMNGNKVGLVQRRLGFKASSWETVDSRLLRAVSRWQRAHGLPATGVVNGRTWRAMGLPGDFCTYDRWTARPALPLEATSTQRVEQLIKFARGYLGKEYVWGGTGVYGYGVDCSGLVLQSLYSAGLDPQPITVLKHTLPEYRTSLELYRHPRLQHVALKDARRGDLVFWKNNRTQRVNHIAIHLGAGKTVEASGSKVHLDRLRDRSSQTLMPTVVRPFP